MVQFFDKKIQTFNFFHMNKKRKSLKRLCTGFSKMVASAIEASPLKKPEKVEKPIFGPRHRTVKELLDLREETQKYS